MDRTTPHFSDPGLSSLVDSTEAHRSSDEPAHELSQIPPAPPQPDGQKRAIEYVLDDTPDQPQKRPRTSPANPTDAKDPVAYWAENGTWPNPSLTTYLSIRPQAYLLARLRTASTISRKQSDSGVSASPSDLRLPEADAGYELLLQTMGTHMGDSNQGIADTSGRLVERLLSSEQHVPRDTIFNDSIFERTIHNLRGKNKARVVQDISRLIVPSAETLALHDEKLGCLIESVNESWNNSIPLLGSQPQPSYSVGFDRETFTDDQLKKLALFISDFTRSTHLSYFLGTFNMYFPFLACETKCGAVNMDISDRQNAHSMSLAVRAVTELFRCVERENEVHREILAFSVSHDNSSVRIYGHYPVIDGEDTRYYRRLIRAFFLDDGIEKWTAYRFIKNLYEIWMPEHLNRICSAIAQMPLDWGHSNAEAEA